ncbi:MAG: iron-sulfur cluster assembly scaffold protein [Candidatus Magasanikbacteria bacterium CG10_big_fil_rev_8_21_14_0_10_43_6]|uniref:Iron-sulfur cluster assembly scaffold protein n=1 Tax=Candidatus Magasanikbacteria bacterium CG10_big_fil_rev_8_21_14_0_10_43_6 TaxID=1974650 RepID=A0A2M6W1C9_9BACT|nr:MAG: iron-sulfur cluster assembly scaffold protein [Candidatus Magasanikbacteria bacterium CG10_big_fil_rev_8_21_14_0_10_43_6]
MAIHTEQSAGAKIKDKQGGSWLYTDVVKDHFFNPRNILKHGEEETYSADGMGRVGSPACGDEMVLWLKIDKDEERITECKWQTFGCGSAIASTSMLSVMVSENGGMKIADALKIKPQDIMERLGGLPNRKIHCSVLGDKALHAAVNSWFRSVGYHDRIQVSGKKVIDAALNITDHDIEEAVLEGAMTLEDVQKKLKVGVASPEAIPEIEGLIRFYSDKYYGESAI